MLSVVIQSAVVLSVVAPGGTFLVTAKAGFTLKPFTLVTVTGVALPDTSTLVQYLLLKQKPTLVEHFVVLLLKCIPLALHANM